MATLELGWLLRAWELAAGVVPAARGAVLVSEAGLVSDLDTAIDLPVDQLATLVARVHREQFGATLAGVLECDACAARLDVDVPVPDVSDESGAGTSMLAPGADSLTIGPGTVVRIRVPTTRDLLAVRERADAGSALVERCVRPVDAAAKSPAPLAAADRALVDARMEQLAAAACVLVRTQCPECGTWLAAPVDVATFLWDRVEREAKSGLADVADLALSFGWAEAHILGLTPRRRAAYLTLVREDA